MRWYELVNSDFGLGIYLSSVESIKNLTTQASTITVTNIAMSPISRKLIIVSIEVLRVKVKECQHRQHK
jgi:hypothetical protein